MSSAEPRNRQRKVLSPEGVELTLELAQRGERAGAFLIDLVIIAIAIFAIVLTGFFLLSSLRGWALALGLVSFFLIRAFYFTFFELHWRGATPGKRALKLRVVDRFGGPLKPDAVVVRNLMREIEFFLPLSLLAMPEAGSYEAWVKLLLLTWSAIFAMMPLFNRDILRVGDMVGGTMVIRMPETVLLPDLAAADTPERRKNSSQARYRFTAEQLAVYGVYELQTLEGVLRRTDINSAQTKAEVARRIMSKIGWQDGDQQVDPEAFLQDFYAAQRARLEHKMLFGVRRKDKHDRA